METRRFEIIRRTDATNEEADQAINLFIENEKRSGWELKSMAFSGGKCVVILERQEFGPFIYAREENRGPKDA